MERHWMAAVALVLVVGACTPRASMIDDRTAIVSGRVGHADNSGTATTALLRAGAKQCLDRGFTYFQVLSTDRSGAIAPVTTGPSASTDSTATPTLTTVPRGEIKVRCYKEGEINPNTSDVWNARAVAGSRS